MRRNYLALLLLVCPIAVQAQNAPTQAFHHWARDHMHPVDLPGEGHHDDADLQVLRTIIGDAHVVALGEPVHGAREPLAMRNQLIRYGVTRLGITAVALETCLSSSKLLYDYVLGRTAETEDLLTSLSVPRFIMDLRRLPSGGPLHEWFHLPHATGQDPYTIVPARA
jgi:erythromycin esterase-like protein